MFDTAHSAATARHMPAGHAMGSVAASAEPMNTTAEMPLSIATVPASDADKKRYQPQGSDTMFTSVQSRANAYRRIAAETSIQGASPHQLVGLLYDALLQSIAAGRGALSRGDIVAKGVAIGKAVRIIEEGLKAGLNLEQGGEIAANLHGLYAYSVTRLTQANVRNDAAALEEVAQMIEPLADAWKQIKGPSPTPSQPAVRLGSLIMEHTLLDYYKAIENASQQDAGRRPHRKLGPGGADGRHLRRADRPAAQQGPHPRRWTRKSAGKRRASCSASCAPMPRSATWPSPGSTTWP